MDYKVRVFNRYLMDIPEEFKKPSKEDDFFKLEGEHKVSVTCNKHTIENMENMKQDVLGLENKQDVSTSSVKVEVLDDLIRNVDDNVQHFIHATLKSDESVTGNWLFFEQVDDVIYTISVEYDHKDEKSQEISSKIINSIVKWEH